MAIRVKSWLYCDHSGLATCGLVKVGPLGKLVSGRYGNPALTQPFSQHFHGDCSPDENCALVSAEKKKSTTVVLSKGVEKVKFQL